MIGDKEREARATASPFTLPVASAALLSDPGALPTLTLELEHANGDLLALVDSFGIAGPFTIQSPWELRDEQGRHLIHAGGYAAIPFGERYPPLLEFVAAYLEHGRQLGFAQQSASEWRAALAENLVALLSALAPSHADSRVFFTNSGAEAVEAGLKMALTHRPKARTIVNFAGGYHGKTLGALAITPSDEYQGPFRPLVPETITLPFGDAQALADTLARHARKIAAVVIEPVLGEGGVVVPPPDYLRQVGELARQHGVPVMADEIQSGLGRTGHWFASVAAGLEPDIITLAKPLGGGLVPIGATIARKDVYRSLLPGLNAKRHSNTFGGGSLAAAVGLKSLELLVEGRLDQRSAEYGRIGLERLRSIAAKVPELIDEVRGAGMLFAMSLRPLVGFRVPGVSNDDMQTFASALALRALHDGGVHGCYSSSANRVVRLTPALNIPEHLFTQLFDRVEAVTAENPRSVRLLQRLELPRLLRLARIAFSS